MVKFLHSMIRVKDLEAALAFFIQGLGLREVRRHDHEAGRFTLVFLATGSAGDAAEVELITSLILNGVRKRSES